MTTWRIVAAGGATTAPPKSTPTLADCLSDARAVDDAGPRAEPEPFAGLSRRHDAGSDNLHQSEPRRRRSCRPLAQAPATPAPTQAPLHRMRHWQPLRAVCQPERLSASSPSRPPGVRCLCRPLPFMPAPTVTNVAHDREKLARAKSGKFAAVSGLAISTCKRGGHSKSLARD